MTSVRVDAVPLIPGCVIVGNTGLGILGSQIPTTGPDGLPPFGLIDLDPADSTNEIRWEILTWPAAGTLVPDENSSFLFTGAPPGTYSFYVRGYVNGRPRAAKIVVIVVGPGDAAVPATLDLT